MLPGLGAGENAIQKFVSGAVIELFPTQDGAYPLTAYRVVFLLQATFVATALAIYRITYLPNDLLTKVDRCSMLHALEVRSPFMDHELVQFAMA